MPIPAATLEAAIRECRPFPKADSRDAADAAATLIACYPNGKPADPKTYIAAIVAVLSQYPIEIVRVVTNPATGIQRKVSFLPSIAEITKALEAEMLPLRNRWREEKERRARQQNKPNEFNPKVAEGFESLVADLAKGLTP